MSGRSDNKFKQASIMENLGENILKKYNKWVYWNEPQVGILFYNY